MESARVHAPRSIDYDSILRNSGNDQIRDADALDRLKRDEWKCAELREHADFVINNTNFSIPSTEITNIINNAYGQHLYAEGVIKK